MSTQSQSWRPKPRPRSKLLARINAAPFVAIFLAILWIMMSPAAVIIHPNGKQVDLAYAASATPQQGAVREDALILSVTRSGDIFFGPTRTLREDLPGQLRARMVGDVERRVYIKADARAKYSDVEGVLSSIREANISDVTLLTEQSSPIHY
jgi:biopolymer transport protein TolR